MIGEVIMDGIKIELILFSDNPNLDVDLVSKFIGIFPVNKESIGDTVYFGETNNLKREVDVSSLMYSTECIKTVEVEVAIKNVVKLIEPKLNNIIEAVHKYRLTSKFCIVISLPEKPIVFLPKEFVEIAAQLRAEIEFDTYIG